MCVHSPGPCGLLLRGQVLSPAISQGPSPRSVSTYMHLVPTHLNASPLAQDPELERGEASSPLSHPNTSRPMFVNIPCKAPGCELKLFFFLAVLHGLQDLSSPTRGLNPGPGDESTES